MDLQGLHLSIPLVKKSTGISTRSPTKDPNISVVLSEDLYIPGSSQVKINAKLIDAVTVGTMLVEGRDITQRSSVMIATGVTKPGMSEAGAEVPVRVLNLSSDGVTIYKGTRLAEASPLEDNNVLLILEVTDAKDTNCEEKVP